MIPKGDIIIFLYNTGGKMIKAPQQKKGTIKQN